MIGLPAISFSQQSRTARYAFVVLLVFLAGLPRVMAAILLPNEEGDPYSYFRAIQIMRAAIVGGTFTIPELFGFWLPLYQFVCASISAVVGDPLYVAKLVSAACGTGVCLLVFFASLRLTASAALAFLSFALIAFNPIHIMYSAFSMSDVPHALLVMGGLVCAMTGHWVLAGMMIASGGLMRPESWAFIPLLPALQWLLQRRVTLTPFIVALVAPAAWIYISWLSTGNPFEYFKVRGEYIKELVSQAPALGQFSTTAVIVDLRTLFYCSGPAVVISCFIAICWIVKRWRQGAEPNSIEPISDAIVATFYFFASLSFLLVAYFTKNQPAIFARYCLVLFALGLPVLAWILKATKSWGRGEAAAFWTVLLGLCVLQFGFQIRDGSTFVKQVSQKRFVADYLTNNIGGTPEAKVFCDDDTVKVLTGIPAGNFLSSANSPGDTRSFLNYLKENHVQFLVWENRDQSAPVSLFAELGDDGIARLFQLVASTSADLRVYRVTF
jgi:hypothetical protein